MHYYPRKLGADNHYSGGRRPLLARMVQPAAESSRLTYYSTLFPILVYIVPGFRVLAYPSSHREQPILGTVR
jgi:hypothetical protein